MGKKWYIIHVFSGAEEFVVKALTEKIKKYKFHGDITTTQFTDIWHEY